ncbi:MAG TPA: tripartite tricarboxylate transporter substrate binding protein [Burkholderiaceae bacterium]|nr:tripartite tricarboxylate transporter substrate binding protein [Burkholderiaceae bacterium]
MKAHRFGLPRTAADVRRCAALTALGLAPLAMGSAQAQEWPGKPITIMVGYAPGGGADIVSRVVGQKMSEILGQPVIVENRPGSAAQIAATAVARSAPDGHTVLVDAAAFAINANLYSKLPYKTSSFQTVGVVATVPLLMVVHPSMPAHSVADVVNHAKANPGKVFFATSGPGSLMNLAGLMFEKQTGVKLSAIPYKGAGAALTDLVGGQVSLYFGNATATLPFVKNGKLRPVAITSRTRSRDLPDTPTLQEENIHGMEIYEWNAMFAPAGTPAPIIGKLSDALRKALASPEVADKLASLGAQAYPGTRAESIQFVDSEISRLGKIIRENNLQAD